MPTFYTKDTGIYIARAQYKNCLYTDTVRIRGGLTNQLLGPDADLCYLDYPHRLALSLPAGATYIWRDSTGRTISTTNQVVLDSGNYIRVQVLVSGCTLRDTVRLHRQSKLIVAITGPQGLCQGKPALLDGGPGFARYLWNGGDTNRFASFRLPGRVHLTGYAANGCMGRDSLTLAALPGPTVSISGPAQFCADSIAHLRVDTGYASITWFNASSRSSIQVDSTALVTVSVMDTNGCQASDTLQVIKRTRPDPMLSGSAYVCQGQQTLLFAGTKFLTYLWNNGSSGRSIQADTSGIYWVHVRDSLGCIGSDTILLAGRPKPLVVISGNRTFCTGDTLQLAANALFAHYQWSSGDTTQLTIYNQAGLVRLMVTDTAGCRGRDSATIIALAQPAPHITGATQLCPQTSTRLDAGSGYVHYTWNTGDTSQLLQASAPGRYWVRVANATGCVGTDTLHLAAAPVPVVTISGPHIICQGESGMLSGPASLTHYQWSTGDTTPEIHISRPIRVSLSASNAAGCRAADTINISQRPRPIVVITGPSSLCLDQIDTLRIVNDGFSPILWSTGVVGTKANISGPGSYWVRVTDTAGCSNIDTIVVAPRAGLPLQITGSRILCPEDTITLTASAGFARYSWSTGQSQLFINTYQAGLYTLTAYDTTGCGVRESALIVAKPRPSSGLPALVQACAYSPFRLAATGGLRSYRWSTGQNTPIILTQALGKYWIHIIDTNGCSATDTLQTAYYPATRPDILGDIVFCIGTHTTLQMGTGYSHPRWSTGDTTFSVDVVRGGQVALTAISQNGCIGRDTVNVAEVASPVFSITGNTGFCPGGVTVLSVPGNMGQVSWTGSATADTNTIRTNQAGWLHARITVHGGCYGEDSIYVQEFVPTRATIIGPDSGCLGQVVSLRAGPTASYKWSTADTISTISIQAPAEVSLITTDIHSCLDTVSLSIRQLASPSITLVGNAAFCPGDTAQIAAIGNYASVRWSDGSILANQSFVQPGLVKIVATASTGCTISDSVLITPIRPTPIQVLPAITSLCPGVLAQLAGSLGFSRYRWQGRIDTTSTIIINHAGTYAITALSPENCPVAAEATVRALPAANVSIAGDSTYCSGSQLQLRSMTRLVHYRWSTGDTMLAINVHQPGLVRLIGQNIAGCQDSALVNIRELPLPNPQIIGPLGLCPGVGARLSLIDQYAAYSWSGGANSSSLAIQAPDFYRVRVLDSAGCSGADSLRVLAFTQPTLNLTGPTQFCHGSTATLSAMTDAEHLLWSTGDTAVEVIVGQSGLYNATATNNQGCIRQKSLAVVQLPRQQPRLNAGGPLCQDSTTVVSCIGAPRAQTYMWQLKPPSGRDTIFGTTLPRITLSHENTVYVHITDNNGCKDSSEPLTIHRIFRPHIAPLADTALCPGKALTLLLLDTLTYKLSVAQSAQHVVRGPLNLIKPGLYKLYASNVCGTTSDVFNIEPTLNAASALPFLHSKSGDTLVCRGEAINHPLYTTDSVVSILSANHNEIGYQNKAYTYVPINSGRDGDPDTLRMMVENTDGCRAQSRLLVQIVDCQTDMYVPTVFSPQADGHNDSWQLHGFGVTAASIRVIDRWGQVVFSTTLFDIASQRFQTSWDGTYKGELCAGGSYAYVLDFSGTVGGQTRRRQRSGFFSLLR